MRELRQDTFFRNKNEDAHDHVDRVLNIISLFNILKLSQDVVLLRVFPFTLTGSTKRWVDRLTPGVVNTWDLLKRTFIQRYYPPSKTAKRPKDIHNFKQESDESLYQAWERYNDLLYKCPTHKVNIFYKGLDTMNHQLLDSQGPIPGMTPTQALTAIQTMAGHSKKWHDRTSSRNVSSNSNTDGLAAIISKLDNLGRDMKKLKENVHAIQVGCQIYEGPHLDKEFPHNEEVKQVDEVKYGKFGRLAPFNESSGAKFRVGPPGYYTRTDNQRSSREKKPNLVETINKSMEEASKRQTPFYYSPEEIRLDFNNAFADLGASISIMAFSIFKRLGIWKLKPINMVIEMADDTKCIPKGIAKILLIKIDKFILPIDSVILDIIKDFRMPVIIGRPLLATAHAKVDRFQKTISVEIGNENVQAARM
ncbi:hypothetical protein Tco_0763116 [Tanacetum coccineum]